MRLLLATVTIVALALGGTALAQPAPPDPVEPGQGLAVGSDLRAPDQVAPAPPAVITTDFRAPDQVSGPASSVPASSVPTPVADGGPAVIVFILIGLGAVLVLLAGGYLGVRHRHRVAVADDLVVP
jgi:hypothetical protein